MARVISICNAKGGVGKTTTAVNLGAYLALLGRRVLLVDFDPQANASSALSGTRYFPKNIYHGLSGSEDPTTLLRRSQIFNYDFIPASQDLSGSLIELVSVTDREYRLRLLLNQIRHKYDYILIDLPPSFSLLTVNGLVASDEVLIPVQAEYYSLEGLSQLLQMIELIRANLKHNLQVAGALLTLYDKRQQLSREVGKNLRRHFPYRVFEVEIPRSVALAEAPSFGLPVIVYDSGSPGALAYKRLAEEVVRQESNYQSPNKEFGNHVR
ncbi:MAG TPA: ParA family protein [Candidatus Paceibacterota bacterium]|nr:ParA family protein [Candidatus Paceibacterota bacterium]